jgi:transcriptional regulator of acetoin/glycerol metabolism
MRTRDDLTATTFDEGERAVASADPAPIVHWVHPEVRITPVPERRAVLGRDQTCDVVLPGIRVSRQHAELCREGKRLVLRDRGSRNGTFVDGERITSVVLGLGHVLRLGDWIGVVSSIPPAATLEAAALGGGLLAGPILAQALIPARKAAPSTLPVVIEGETGTGKERVARAVHEWSGRQGPFLAVNCGALPEAMAESELFGYRRGAFTGAERANDGCFRAAHGGTLLLDEIIELPPPLQTKLLRVLEEGEVTPLGEPRPIKVDVRVIAAAQRPLAEMVRQGRLRADLLARLDGVTVRLPPLRERIAEAPALFFEHLRAAGTKPDAVEPRLVERLCLYPWPLNVREVVLLARRLHALHGTEQLTVAALPEAMRTAVPPPRPPMELAPEESPKNENADLDRLLVALRELEGNLAQAAARAGLSRQRAYRLLQANPHIQLDEFRANRRE